MCGCESWLMKKENEETLVRAGRRISMICGVTLAHRRNSRDLQERVRLVDDIVVGVKKARLRGFGHVFRRDLDVGVKRAFLFKLGNKVGRRIPQWTCLMQRRNLFTH